MHRRGGKGHLKKRKPSSNMKDKAIWFRLKGRLLENGWFVLEGLACEGIVVSCNPCSTQRFLRTGSLFMITNCLSRMRGNLHVRF